ncbi:MAG: rod shape-determining protein MreC [Magnetovibrio sp.]|nr:rod shape-determining protein MreC [Magnetovibrio sp.]
MKNSTRTDNRIAAPVKSVTQRFTYLLLILSAIGVLVIGRVDVASMEQVRTQIVDAVAPILDVIGRPVESFNVGVDRIHEIYTVFDANQKLRQERDRLLHWQALARKLETENRALKGLLNFNAGPEPRFIAARVVADTGGAFAHSLILNAGERAGVRKGQAAVTGDGLIGRISGVGSRSSRLLLITDLNSRIPIVIESTRIRAVLAGTNAGRPRMIHLPTGAMVAIGDRVVTSGHGGVFPNGLPVGVVTSVTDGIIEIQPYVNRERIEYVRVLDYGLRGIVQSGPDRRTGSNVR